MHEFLNVVTHPRIYDPPTPLESALDQVETWFESPRLVLLSEPDQYWSSLRATLQAGHVKGPRVHDARIIAICRSHGVRELWSADRDFRRFPGVSLINPLIG
jgi:predicted nucleic acid-binding protein